MGEKREVIFFFLKRERGLIILWQEREEGDKKKREKASVLETQARALPISLVLTDLDLQYMWVNDVDYYFVPRDSVITMLEAYNGLTSGAAVQAIGIPIFPAFAEKAKDARAEGAVEIASRLRELEAIYSLMSMWVMSSE